MVLSLIIDYFTQLQTSLKEQARAGTFVPQGSQDILTTALGKPDHPGRPLGYPAGYGLKDVFGKLRRGSATSSETVSRVVRQNEELQTEVVGLKGQMGSMTTIMSSMLDVLTAGGFPIPPELAAHLSQCAPSQHPGTRESHSPDDPDIPEGMARFYVEPARLVGWGTVDRERRKLHGRDVAAGEVVVQIYGVRDDAQEVPLPFPDSQGEAATVGEAAAGQIFVLWLERLIDVRVCFIYSYIFYFYIYLRTIYLF